MPPAGTQVAIGSSGARPSRPSTAASAEHTLGARRRSEPRRTSTPYARRLRRGPERHSRPGDACARGRRRSVTAKPTPKPTTTATPTHAAATATAHRQVMHRDRTTSGGSPIAGSTGTSCSLTSAGDAPIPSYFAGQSAAGTTVTITRRQGLPAPWTTAPSPAMPPRTTSADCCQRRGRRALPVGGTTETCTITRERSSARRCRRVRDGRRRRPGLARPIGRVVGHGHERQPRPVRWVSASGVHGLRLDAERGVRRDDRLGADGLRRRATTDADCASFAGARYTKDR